MRDASVKTRPLSCPYSQAGVIPLVHIIIVQLIIATIDAASTTMRNINITILIRSSVCIIPCFL